MIKIAFCLRRLTSFSSGEFLHYWFEQHAPLVRQHAQTLRIHRYVQSHSFSDSRLRPALVARGSIVEPYDGIAELWWHSLEDLIEAGASPEGRAAGRALLDDESRFIDLPNSPIFYAHEHEIIGALSEIPRNQDIAE